MNASTDIQIDIVKQVVSVTTINRPTIKALAAVIAGNK
ncbi:Uncharacterised protein [Vibrio cholerae]|nr:Uncharacterised protein [Vibrio cholerae]